MSDITKTELEVMGATVPFFTYTIEETQYFEFDTSMCGPPDPMVNAMAGLKLIDAPKKKLVMINHKFPGGLISKIGENYDFERGETADGKISITFAYKTGESEKADLTQNSCGG
jgi:hypothetical protein